MQLDRYLKATREEIDKFNTYGLAESIEFMEEIRAGKQAVLSIRVELVDGTSLYVKEYIDARYKIEKVSYAYQYQKKNGELIFRYDNAVHKPDLGFKEHMHTADGSIIQAKAPEIKELVDNIISMT